MHETANPVYEQIVIAGANKTIVGGAAVATAGGAAVRVSWIAAHGSEIATVCSMIGAMVAVIGLAVSIAFQIRRDWRERAELIERRKFERRQGAKK